MEPIWETNGLNSRLRGGRNLACFLLTFISSVPRAVCVQWIFFDWMNGFDRILELDGNLGGHIFMSIQQRYLLPKIPHRMSRPILAYFQWQEFMKHSFSLSNHSNWYRNSHFISTQILSPCIIYHRCWIDLPGTEAKPQVVVLKIFEVTFYDHLHYQTFTEFQICVRVCT